MLQVGQIQYITGLEKYEGLSLREICKRTGHHFNTVKKYVDKEDWNEEIKPKKVRKSKLDNVKPIIDKWLRNDLKMPRKQRHTGIRVYERLVREHKDKLLVGKRQLATHFERFVLHFGFKPAFCNPNKGQEKGSVENKVGYKRRNFFVPLPKINNLNEFNKNLFLECEEDLKRTYYAKKELISELFENDKSELNPLPKERFNIIHLEKVKTDKYSFANYKYTKITKYQRF